MITIMARKKLKNKNDKNMLYHATEHDDRGMSERTLVLNREELIKQIKDGNVTNAKLYYVTRNGKKCPMIRVTGFGRNAKDTMKKSLLKYGFGVR